MSKADEEDYPLCFRLDSGKQKGKLDDQECFPEITIIEKLRGKRQMAKGNNTKAKIARVAWKLFHEKGYEETTIDEIILQSGTSKGSFYHYYSGKDELLASLPEIFDAKYEEVMQALDPEMDSFDKLMTLCFSVHDLIESDIPVGLLASLYSSQVVTKGDKHLLNQGSNAKSKYRAGMLFRLADFYLLYAEALNHVNPSDERIIAHIDSVRYRAGIPLLKDIKPEIKGNQALQEEAIRKERRIELFAEGQRYFDVRRWMCADEEGYKQGGPVHGMNMNADNLEDFMERTAFETRIFERRMYLYPIPLNEIQKSSKLVQNPGW